MSQQHDRIEQAIEEIKAPLLAMDEDAITRLAGEVLAARRIVLFGMGRELPSSKPSACGSSTTGSTPTSLGMSLPSR
jgi:hypothetical protein